MSSAAFVVPGHHEPLAAWSTERLKSALEDFRYDLENGFLPEDAAREVLAHVSNELERRERDAPAPGHSADGRALETWFGMEEARVPALRAQGVVQQPEAGRAANGAREVAPGAQASSQLAQGRDLGLDP